MASDGLSADDLAELERLRKEQGPLGGGASSSYPGQEPDVPATQVDEGSPDTLRASPYTQSHTLGLEDIVKALGLSPTVQDRFSIPVHNAVTEVPRIIGSTGGALAGGPVTGALTAGATTAAGGYLGDKADSLINSLAGTPDVERQPAAQQALGDAAGGALADVGGRLLAGPASRASAAYTPMETSQTRAGESLLSKAENSPTSYKEELANKLDPEGMRLQGALGFSRSTYEKGSPKAAIDKLYSSGALSEDPTITGAIDAFKTKLSSEKGLGELETTKLDALKKLTEAEPEGGAAFWGYNEPVSSIKDAIDKYPPNSIGADIARKAEDAARTAADSDATTIRSKALAEINRVTKERKVTDGYIPFSDIEEIRTIFQNAAKPALEGAINPFSEAANSIRASLTGAENSVAKTIGENIQTLPGDINPADAYISAKQEQSALLPLYSDVKAAEKKVATEANKQANVGQSIGGVRDFLKWGFNKLGLVQEQRALDSSREAYLGRYLKGEAPPPQFDIHASDFGGIGGPQAAYAMQRMKDVAMDQFKNSTYKSWEQLFSKNPWPLLVRAGILRAEEADPLSSAKNPAELKQAIQSTAASNPDFANELQNKGIPVSDDVSSQMSKSIRDQINTGDIDPEEAYRKATTINKWNSAPSLTQ